MEWITTAHTLLTALAAQLSEVTAIQYAIIAGLGLILGYMIYIPQSLRRQLDPHPVTWVMFAYSTLVLTALEFDLGAEWPLLLLPVACAILSVKVAFICWKRGTVRWPDDWEDRLAFSIDLLLTAGYIGAWVLVKYGSITDASRETAVLWFLLLSNLSTLAAFTPLLRDAYLHPSHERSAAWIVWSFAYTMLGISTYMLHGFMTMLMVYPVSNAVLHFSVAWLARPARKRRHAAHV